MKKIVYPIIILVILVGLGAGTVYASNDSLPGDLLYPVKVNFVEEVQSATKLSDEAKAQWAIERINRRLEEIKTLSSMLDSIDPEIINIVEQNIESNNEKLISTSESLKGNFGEEEVEKLLENIKNISDSFSEITSSENFSEIIETTQQTNSNFAEDLSRPPFTITIPHILPSAVSVLDYTDEVLEFGKIIITANGDYDFDKARLGCIGDSRIIDDIGVVTEGDYKNGTNPTIIPTYGGFKIDISPANDTVFDMDKGETKIFKLLMSFKDPSTVKGVNYPVEIKCGPEQVPFINKNTGYRVAMSQYKHTDWYESSKAFKTTFFDKTVTSEQISDNKQGEDDHNDYLEGNAKEDDPKERDEQRLEDVKNIQRSLEMFFAKNTSYPTESFLRLGRSNGICLNENGFGIVGCENPIMSEIPSDPLAPKWDYVYTYSKLKPNTYKISFNTETDTAYLKAGKIEATPSGFSNIQTTEEPIVDITVFDDVLPTNIYASQHAGSAINFAKVKISSNKDIKFNSAKLGCKGDTRVISAIFVTDNTGYTIMPGKQTTYGGFESTAVPYSNNNPYIINAGEEKEISVNFGIKDPSWVTNDDPYPVDISCGFKTVYFTDLETGKSVPFNNYKITNKLAGLQAMKTTLHK